MNNKTLPTGVKTRQLKVNGKTQILVSSPYENEIKNSIGKYSIKEKIGTTILYVVCGILTVFLGYFLGIITGAGELINSLF